MNDKVYLASASTLVNTTALILDMFIAAIPTRIFHFYLGSLFTMIYGGLTPLHQQTTLELHKNIFDWYDEPIKTAILLLLASFAVAPCIQFLLFCVHWMRVGMCSLCVKRQPGEVFSKIPSDSIEEIVLSIFDFEGGDEEGGGTKTAAEGGAKDRGAKEGGAG